METRSIVAAVRFGLGRRPDDPAPNDPVAWLDRQLAAPPRPPAPDLPDLSAAFAAFRADRMDPPGPGRPSRAAGLFRKEAADFLSRCIGSDAPFRERLVAFWANHLTVSRRRVIVVPVAGHYVREAIAPHVTGRFADMLLAAVRHPAMLQYLDNAGSFGPDSALGRRSNRGLNENLAREVLELHTVTPAAGYTQADVTEFARILTGWSVQVMREPAGFVFRPAAHQPGAKTLMGRRYEEGEQAGVEALAWLAEHPATHRHLATKLVRHFVADDPPPAAVDRIFAVLRDTRGDLGAAARALLRLPQAWAPSLSKIRSPQDFVVGTLRAAGVAPETGGDRALGSLNLLNQPLWSAPAPIGWPDDAANWAVPEQMIRRVEWTYALAGFAGRADAGEIASAVLGPLAKEETLRAAALAGSAREALTIALTAPEFQRR